MKPESEVIEDEAAWIWLENGIIYFLYKEGAVVDLAIQKRHIESRIAIGGGVKRPVFADATRAKYWTREAKEYSFKNFQGVSALVLFIHGEVQRIIVNSAFLISKPSVPLRAFTNKEKALEWLERFK